MSSTQSSTSWSNWSPLSLMDRAKRLILNRSQVQVMGQYAATESVARNLKREDDRAERYHDMMMHRLYGIDSKKDGVAEDGDMGDTYFGDRVTQVHQHPQAGMSTAAKLAAVAMLAAGVPGALIAYQLPYIIEAMRPDVVQSSEPKQESADTDTTLDVGLGGGTVIDER